MKSSMTLTDLLPSYVEKGGTMSKGSTYKCNRCGQTITVYVTPTHPPTCSQHTGGGVKMQLQD